LLKTSRFSRLETRSFPLFLGFFFEGDKLTFQKHREIAEGDKFSRRGQDFRGVGGEGTGIRKKTNARTDIANVWSVHKSVCPYVRSSSFKLSKNDVRLAAGVQTRPIIAILRALSEGIFVPFQKSLMDAEKC
jgi:hypothetical protein